MQRHFIGLTVAARYAQRGGWISGQMRKKLILLDNAFAVARHITQPASRDLLSGLRDMLAKSKRDEERQGGEEGGGDVEGGGRGAQEGGGVSGGAHELPPAVPSVLPPGLEPQWRHSQGTEDHGDTEVEQPPRTKGPCGANFVDSATDLVFPETAQHRGSTAVELPRTVNAPSGVSVTEPGAATVTRPAPECFAACMLVEGVRSEPKAPPSRSLPLASPSFLEIPACMVDEDVRPKPKAPPSRLLLLAPPSSMEMDPPKTKAPPLCPPGLLSSSCPLPSALIKGEESRPPGKVPPACPLEGQQQVLHHAPVGVDNCGSDYSGSEAHNAGTKLPGADEDSESERNRKLFRKEWAALMRKEKRDLKKGKARARKALAAGPPSLATSSAGVGDGWRPGEEAPPSRTRVLASGTCTVEEQRAKAPHTGPLAVHGVRLPSFQTTAEEANTAGEWAPSRSDSGISDGGYYGIQDALG